MSERKIPNEIRVPIKKLDAKKQIAMGEVYIPYVPDSQGDFMTPEEIERVAHNFLKKGAVEAIDTEHNLTRNGSVVVESFIAREGDSDFVPGSWVLGVHIPDKEHWAKAERGEIGGFSMYGTGRRQQRIVEIEIPDDGMLFGKTADTTGYGAHSHLFALDFDEKGTFLGGETDEVNGHTHVIKKGTVTEPGPDGHRHRFSFLDMLVKGCSGMTAEQKKWKAIRENKKRMRKGDEDDDQVLLAKEWNEEDHPRGKTTEESNSGSFMPKLGAPGETSIATPDGMKSVKSWPFGVKGLVITEQVREAQGAVPGDKRYRITHEGTGKAISPAFGSRKTALERAGNLIEAFPAINWTGDEQSLKAAIGPRAREVGNIMRGLPASTPVHGLDQEGKPKARRGIGDYVSFEGRTALSRYDDFEAGRVYAYPSYRGQGFFRAETRLKNGNWKGTVLDEGAGGRTRGKTKIGIFEPPRKGSSLKWYELKDDEIPLHIRKEDMDADDMPEPVPEQLEALCEHCNTAKACRKAGHCLISEESEERAGGEQ